MLTSLWRRQRTRNLQKAKASARFWMTCSMNSRQRKVINQIQKSQQTNSRLWQRNSKPLSREFSAQNSQMTQNFSLKAVSEPCSRAGMARKLYHTEESKVFLRIGEQPSTCRRWCSATWVKTQQQALLSHVTQLQVTTSSTVSGLSTHRAKTSWQVSAPLTR